MAEELTPQDILSMRVEDLKRELRNRSLLVSGVKRVLQQRLLRSHLENILAAGDEANFDGNEEVLELLGEDLDRPPASLNGADWGASNAKHLIAQDLLDNIVPCAERIEDIKQLFDELYAHQPEFKDFPFDEPRYRARIEHLQTVVRRLKWSANYDKQCLAEARAMHPKQTHGPTGTILWADSEADRLLKIDMSNNKHLEMTPQKLRETKPEYQLFSKKRFSKRIDQLTEAAKPYGMNPMQAAAKKANKEKKKIENRPDISRAATQSPYHNT